MYSFFYFSMLFSTAEGSILRSGFLFILILGSGGREYVRKERRKIRFFFCCILFLLSRKGFLRYFVTQYARAQEKSFLRTKKETSTTDESFFLFLLEEIFTKIFQATSFFFSKKFFKLFFLSVSDVVIFF